MAGVGRLEKRAIRQIAPVNLDREDLSSVSWKERRGAQGSWQVWWVMGEGRDHRADRQARLAHSQPEIAFAVTGPFVGHFHALPAEQSSRR